VFEIENEKYIQFNNYILDLRCGLEIGSLMINCYLDYIEKEKVEKKLIG